VVAGGRERLVDLGRTASEKTEEKPSGADPVRAPELFQTTKKPPAVGLGLFMERVTRIELAL